MTNCSKNNRRNQGRQVTLIMSYRIPVDIDEPKEDRAIIGAFRLGSDEAWIMNMSGANATPAHANPNKNLTPQIRATIETALRRNLGTEKVNFGPDNRANGKLRKFGST
jgi:hypothetical protein